MHNLGRVRSNHHAISHVQVLDFLAENAAHEPAFRKRKIPVAASVSLTLTASVTAGQILHRIEAFFNQAFDIDHVICLLEHTREFWERKAQAASGGKGALPMLSSACSGWVYYAEKTHSEMLPFISRTKNPQQVMGLLSNPGLHRSGIKSMFRLFLERIGPALNWSSVLTRSITSL